MPVEHYVVWTATAVWAVALSWVDCRTRRLPNAGTLGGAIIALVFRLGYGGMPFFVDGFAAAAAAAGFLLVPFLMRGAGGGDVKMLFAAGAIAGWSRVFHLLWATSLAGVIFGLFMLAIGALDGARLAFYARSLFDWRFDRKAAAAALPPKDAARYRIPFSVPITVGLLVALAW